ncbi:S-layer homology domain-containing protein [Dysosmobacter sp.]|uniref:S-layer homology domain-containing protein n=1 Tax=Dysosmobacter sp. TaxID=2591382 RepID=UPI003AEF5BE8
MKKRILSCLMALALCLTLLPTAALAEETEGTAQTSPAVEESTDPANGEAKQESQPAEQEEQQEDSAAKQAVAAVQAMIDALPDAEALDGMDDTARESACLAASEAYEAYDALTEDQQSALTGTEKMIAILEWTTEQVALAANEDLSSHTHEGWTAINTATELTGIDKAGNYYLTDNVTLTENEAWKPADGVVLCLNGYSITGADGQEAIQVNSGVTFTLTDCHTGNEVGQITHKTDASGCGVYVQYGTFNMYGGSITGNTVGGSGGGVCATNSSTFNMYGGSITGNSASQGGGVYAASTFNMYGGTISDNSASQGGGVFVSTQHFTVSGNAKITDNTDNGGSEKNNVYLNYSGTSIQIGTEGLQSGAKIGVTTYATPSNSAPVTIVSSDAKAGYEEYFTSDKEGCYPVYQGGKIVLYAGAPHKHPICGETCADGEHTQNITWTPIETEGELKAASANGYYYLTKDVTLTSTWTPANDVKLCLNGHTITTTANVDAIEVGQNVTFTLTNCKGTGKITHQYTGQDNRVYTAKGCGAYVNGGTFHLYGGTFSKNIGHNIGQNTNGGGVYVENSSTFYMYGGSITDNIAGSTNDYTDGGGVYVKNYSTFHMSGGSIIGNSSGSCGGVYVEDNSTFTMSGSASITGNWTNGSGGGVYVKSYSTFEMHDNASITGNSAKSQGGGVHVAWSGTFHMSGGSITGNNVKNNNGGGVNLASGSFTVSGSANITGNVKGGKKSNGIYTGGTANNVGLNVDSSITIGDGLTGTARIGVANEPTESNPVKIATGATDTALDYAKIFTPDAMDQGYVVNNEGGTLFLTAHRHSWTYALKEGTTDTIIAACDAEGCANRDGGSVMISASDAAYDRGAKAATVTASNDWKGDAVDSIAVKYAGRSGTVYDSSDAPTNAGKYTASITLGNATASVEYEITKVAPKIASWSPYTGPLPAYNGEQVKNPTYLPMTFGEFADITGFKWYQATKNEDNSYTKGEELSAPPTDAGDYYIEAIFKAGTNTTAGIEGTGLTVKPMQTEKVVNAKEYPVYANRAYAYEIDLNSYLTDLKLGTGVTYTKTNGDLPDYFKAGELSISSDGKLTVPVKKTTTAPLPSTIATIVVWVKSSNYGRITLSVPIQMVAKKSENLAVSMTGWTYGETASTPEYTVPDGVTAEVTYAKADGTVLGERPTNAGDYTVTVSYETDNEIHTGTAEFTISPKLIEGATVTRDQSEQVYDGGEKKPAVTSVVLDGNTLTAETEYTVAYANNINATKLGPDSQAKIIITGTGNYTGEVTVLFPINPVKLSIIGEDRMTATASYGLQVKEIPVSSATVYYDSGKVTKVPGTWKFDGDGMDDIPEVGNTKKYKAVFTPTSGSENYRECFTYITPSISRADGSVTAPAAKTGLVYNGEEQALLETLPTSSTGTVWYSQDGTNYTKTPPMGQEAGTYTVFYKVLGDKNHLDVAAQSIHVEIEKLAITVTAENKTSRVGLALAELTYTYTPELAAEDAFTGTLESNARPDAAGSYSITQGDLALNENYTIDFHAGTYTVADKLVQSEFRFESIPSAVSKTYGDPDFSAGAVGAAEGSTVTYESSAPAVATVDGTGKVTIKGAGTAVITARASATDEYAEAAATCNLTVGKKPIAIPTADATVFTYNGTEQTYALAEDGAYTITGNKQTNANETGYSVTAALKDTANTQWADGTTADKTYTFVIGKAVITVKAKDQSAYVGDKVPALSKDSYTVSGLVGEEKLTTQPTVKYVGADGSEITPDMTKTGEVKILASGAAASDNYTIRYEDGKLTVSTRPSGGGGSSRPSTHPVQTEVSKDPDGTVSLSRTSAAKGDKVTITVKPERHYEVDEVIVRDSKGKQLAVKDNGDGTFTFEMPADKVTVEPTFSWVNPFADVANSAYYVDAVEWMLKREVTQGTTETTFSPNLNCTRAQIVTFLWRAAGSPEPKGTVSFADVSAGSYYAKAVAWAIENGITGGTGDGLFSPDAACTRAQSAAFLYRAAGSPAVNGSAGFSDVAADAYYAQAVAWAKEHGITDGIGGGLFGSANDCTRAQIAAFLWRLYAEK